MRYFLLNYCLLLVRFSHSLPSLFSSLMLLSISNKRIPDKKPMERRNLNKLVFDPSSSHWRFAQVQAALQLDSTDKANSRTFVQKLS